MLGVNALIGSVGAALLEQDRADLRTAWSSSRTPSASKGSPSRRYRTIWISDTHLGTRGCKAELLLNFLVHHECDMLYLVGDIVDGWRLSRSWFWHRSHNAVIDEILRKAHTGTRVIYIPGNHDEVLRDYAGLCFAGIEVAGDAIHATADGRKLLVLHGDHFDGVVTYARWLAMAGDQAYALALKLNDVVAAVRRRIGLPYWSLSRWLKDHVKKAVAYIDRFEQAVALEAQRRHVDGVVCGHIHKAEIRQIGNVLYCNDGDWVESCTALVEDYAGKLQIVTWTQALPTQQTAAQFAQAAE
jgi:UDP-2,3-diacylglucosamine pyrophosphatase LpxH